MAPLHKLLVAAIDRAQAVRPDLTLADIAAEADIHRQALYRARHACSEDTLGKVLAAIGKLTGVRLNVALVEEPAE